MSKFLESLNNSQREAVETTEGPLMVIAGAGSGKTRVLTYRIAYLLEQGANPFNVLALTFTNKAAREMKSRIVELVGKQKGMNVWMGTFHSIFARILRIEAERIGYDRNFTIYDSDDSKSVIRKIVKEMDLDNKIYTLGAIMNRISGAKSNLISAAAYAKNSDLLSHDLASKRPLIHEIYKTYSLRLRRAMAMDFDDLLFQMNVLLRDNADLLLKYQHKFTHILVDEFQDTNFAQYLIIRQLAANDENICIVGDDAQSIYAFRGADIQNILNFKKDYPDLKTIKLEQNYRSTQNIVKAANSIISHNKNQIFKNVWTDNDTGTPIKVIKTLTDNEEAKNIAQKISDTKQQQQATDSEFAILYRTNAQSRPLELELRKRGIAYRIYGGLSFYSRKEIKDMLAYFRLIINNNDEVSMLRIINFPARGIGQTTLNKIVDATKTTGVPMWDIVENPTKYNIGLNSKKTSQLVEFAKMIKRFKAQLLTMNAFDLAYEITVASGIKKMFEDDKTPEGVAQLRNLEELLNAIKDFTNSEDLPPVPGAPTDEDTSPSLDIFMQDIALLTDADKNSSDDGEKVTLMTIHAAKGLEFPYVYLSGLEENLFPNSQSLNSRDDLEEERRLFYVAVTRAEKQLTISYAENRYKWGQLQYNDSSRFLDEIDSRYIEYDEIKTVLPRRSEARQKQKRTFTRKEKPTNQITTPLGMRPVSQKSAQQNGENQQISPNFDIQTGMIVEHSRFGKGKVVAIEGTGSNKKATVFFQNVGNKQLLLKFARLKVVE